MRLGAGRIDSLIVTPLITSPTPRWRLYRGSYDDTPTVVWDSNDDYPSQALTADESFEYLVGISIEASDLLVLSVEDDGVTTISAFSWALVGEGEQ